MSDKQSAANFDSYKTTRLRFDDERIASEYVDKKNHLLSRKNRRELRCILAGLGELSPNSKVLDIPCGTGRLASALLAKNIHLTESDAAAAMLDQARKTQAKLLDDYPGKLEFVQQDIMHTTFDDKTFDAVICNRLFHHYPEPVVRRQVLLELKRICRGPIVVSYFSNFAISAFKFHLKNKIKGVKPDDRIPIWEKAFQADIAACGLIIDGRFPVRLGVSPQTYLRLIER